MKNTSSIQTCRGIANVRNGVKPQIGIATKKSDTHGARETHRTNKMVYQVENGLFNNNCFHNHILILNK